MATRSFCLIFTLLFLLNTAAPAHAGELPIEINRIGERVLLLRCLSNNVTVIAEAYWKAGDTGAAIDNYERSLSLEPSNRNAEQMLELLQD